MTVELEEGERQLVLLALAHLAVERPGWYNACYDTALAMDDLERHAPKLFIEFYKLRRDTVRDSLPEDPTPESLNRALAKFDNEDVPVRDCGHQVPSG